MFTATEIYQYCRERIDYPLPPKPEYDRLHSVFAELSEPDIEELFSHIECGDVMLPRLLAAKSYSNPPIDPNERLQSFIAKFRKLAGEFLNEEDIARWSRVDIDSAVTDDDDDLIYTIYDSFGDWIANGGPDTDHPIHMLTEALYSIRADYLVSRYITWPLNERRLILDFDPLTELFELSVRGYHLAFNGDRINATKPG